MSRSDDVRVRFGRDFDFSPAAMRGAVTIAYKAGDELPVTRECADAAVKDGAGEVVKAKARKPGAED